MNSPQSLTEDTRTLQIASDPVGDQVLQRGHVGLIDSQCRAQVAGGFTREDGDLLQLLADGIAGDLQGAGVLG